MHTWIGKGVAFVTSIKRKTALRGAVVVLLVLAGSYMWAGGGAAEEKVHVAQRGDFLQQVSASGKVVPTKEVELGFTAGGRISSVNAAVGSRVGQGAVIASIDSGDIRANLLQRQAALETEEAKLAALKAGSRPEEIAVAEADVAGDKSALVQANQALVEEMQDAYAAADQAVRTDVYQFVSNPRSTNPVIDINSTDTQAVVDLKNYIVEIEPILASWSTQLSSLQSTKETITLVQGNLSKVSKLLLTANAVLARALPSSSVTEAEIVDYVADVASARTSVNTAIAAVTSAVTTQKNAEAALDASEKNLTLKKAGTLQADIDAQTARVKAAEADVENVRAQLSKTLILAPFTGVITDVDAKVGAIASANTTMVKMISADTYQIESFVPEINIARLKVGNPADVTLDAYGDEVTFGARVVSIDPAETIRDGVSTYRVVLQFERSDERIRSGMTANILITAGKRTDVLSIPVGLVADVEDKKIVRVKSGEEITERTVTTGELSSSGQIEILTGLQGGETLLAPEEKE